MLLGGRKSEGIALDREAGQKQFGGKNDIPERLPNKVFMLRSRKQGGDVAKAATVLSAWSQASIFVWRLTGFFVADKGVVRHLVNR